MEPVPQVWSSELWIVLSAELCYIIQVCYIVVVHLYRAESHFHWNDTRFEIKSVWCSKRMGLAIGGVGAVLGLMDGYTCFQLQSVCNPGANGKTLLF